MKRRTFIKTTIGAGAGITAIGSGCIHTEPQDFTYPETPEFLELQGELKQRNLILTDFHIHMRGGMTGKKAAVRERTCGIKSAVLKNFGREWPLKNSTDLAAFINENKRVEINNSPIPTGIQVNDRDWYRQIDKSTFSRLTYVLADTMIMGVTKEGKPRRLWKDDVLIEKPELWMEQYLQHNLSILDEPVTILANPTYLPKCIAHLYDQLWTDKRMEEVISKAIQNKVALEVQLETKFARQRFLKKAKDMGGVFSFGSNNFTAKTKNVSNWLTAIRLLDLQQKDVLTTPKRLVYPA